MAKIRRSTIHRITKAATKLAKGSLPFAKAAGRVVARQQARSIGGIPGIARGLMGGSSRTPSSLGDFVQQYARKNTGGVLGRALDFMGPFGQMVKQVLRSIGTVNATVRDIQAAVDIIHATGGRVAWNPQVGMPSVVAPPIISRGPSNPPGFPGRSISPIPPPIISPQSIQTVIDRITQSPPVSEPEPTPGHVEAPESQQPRTKQPRSGDKQAIEPQVYLTPGSSNVYGFWYDESTTTKKGVGSLFVMFQAHQIHGTRSQSGGFHSVRFGAKLSTQKGATYEYMDVPRWIFLKFVRIAAGGGKGAGVEVWDDLRIRGSIYGHRYRYRLSSGAIGSHIAGGAGIYIPRRVTREGFKVRQISTTKGAPRSTLSLPSQRGHSIVRRS